MIMQEDIKIDRILREMGCVPKTHSKAHEWRGYYSTMGCLYRKWYLDDEIFAITGLNERGYPPTLINTVIEVTKNKDGSYTPSIMSDYKKIEFITNATDEEIKEFLFKNRL